MFFAEALILIAGVLILLGIASSKFSARAGIPVLVLFLVLGMLTVTVNGLADLAYRRLDPRTRA